jgi:hypothetical protein
MRKLIALLIAFCASSFIIASASGKPISVGIPQKDVKAICGMAGGCVKCSGNEQSANCRNYTCDEKGKCTVTVIERPAPSGSGPKGAGIKSTTRHY